MSPTQQPLFPSPQMAAMGIDWMTGDELSQAIPPAYSRYIAEQLTPVLAAKIPPKPAHAWTPAELEERAISRGWVENLGIAPA